MAYNVFVINPGSTSTKIAVYEENDCIVDKTINHLVKDLNNYNTAISQLDFRFDAISKVIKEKNIDLAACDAFAGRGGLLRPLKGGTYCVNNAMLEDLLASRYGNHASNLGAVIANKLSDLYGKPAFVVNPVVVDEMTAEARFTGLPEIKRKSVFHALNHKAIGERTAQLIDIPYTQASLIIAHLGGGISVGAHYRGNVIDTNNALEEGPFSPERAGSLPTDQLVDMCFSGKYSKSEIKKMLVGKGGLTAYTGTNDCRRLIEVSGNDPDVIKVLDAMSYKISREICSCAAALYGKVDAVVLTGGLAHSEYIVGKIRSRVSFLGEFVVFPGEDEMVALAEGVLNVLHCKDIALEY